MTDRIPDYSDADMAALSTLTDAAITTNKATQELVRVIAAGEGINLSSPQSDKPRRRRRTIRITRNADG
jgi:hypothetical protein